jgi:hypothetical protein
MKKISLVYILVILLSIVTFGLVSAQSGMGNVKGQVTAYDAEGGQISLLTRKGEEVVVQAPEGFDFSAIEEGSFLHAKGRFNEQGIIVADWIKDSKARDDDGEGGKTNSAFCSGRKDKPHPLAAGIEEIYGYAPEETMAYFCDGIGFGQIMLAIQTAEMKGLEVSEILSTRKSGLGWGQIWKEYDLVGKPGEASSPPGHLKRPDHAGPKEGKGQNKP